MSGWVTTLRTTSGERWTFRYQGGQLIYVAVAGMRESMVTLPLADHDLTPDTITRERFLQIGRGWIEGRNSAPSG